jgi:phosphopantothenoylcysteine decarboxylase/phosphopantothenate--cysteine ligase
MDAVEGALSVKDLAGERMLVTAGPTQEAIDPVRFISNRSSGAMGFAIARAARLRGAEVVLVSGPTCRSLPPGITRVDVTSAAEMARVSEKHYAKSTVVVMAAAVADYAPVKAERAKIKKGAKKISIELAQTTDILKRMGLRKRGRFLVGFALETERMEENARKKLKEKKLDMVVANSPAGIGTEANEAVIIGPDGFRDAPGPLSKRELADRILDNVVKFKRPAGGRKGK